MSATIITLEIAEKIKEAILKIVPDGTTVCCDGVADEPSPDGDEVKLPCVAIVVNECLPMQYRSKLRAYPVAIEATTWYPKDKDQVVLYTLGKAVSEWLALPVLELTLATWDALIIDNPPERSVAKFLQYFRWEAKCHVMKSS